MIGNFQTVGVLKPLGGECLPDDYTSDAYWAPYNVGPVWDAGNGWWDLTFPSSPGYMRLEEVGSWVSGYTPYTMTIQIEMDGIDPVTYPSEWVLFTDTQNKVFSNFDTDFSEPIVVNLDDLPGTLYRIRHTWNFGTPTSGSLRIRSIEFNPCSDYNVRLQINFTSGWAIADYQGFIEVELLSGGTPVYTADLTQVYAEEGFYLYPHSFSEGTGGRFSYDESDTLLHLDGPGESLSFDAVRLNWGGMSGKEDWVADVSVIYNHSVVGQDVITDYSTPSVISVTL